jgi:hypothetical protein
LLWAAGGRSAISKQAPMPLIAECALLPPANAQAAAVIPMLPAAARLNICRRYQTRLVAGLSLVDTRWDVRKE